MKRKLLYKLFPICLALLLAVGSPVYAQPVGADPPSQDIFIQTKATDDPAPEIPKVTDIPEIPKVPESPEITDTLKSQSQEEPAATPSDGLSDDVSEEILDAADVDKLQRMLADEGYIGIAPMSVEYISNFAQLENALRNPEVTIVAIMGDIEMERTLTIDRDLTFLAFTDTVLWAPSTYNPRHFYVTSTIPHESVTIDFNRIILDGRGTGGGLHVSESSLNLKGAVIQNCRTTYSGGAIYFDPGNLTLENCMITGNTSVYGGGGIYAFSQSVTVVNSTISSNESQEGFGGGICCDNGTLTLDNSTVTDNYSGEHGGGVTTHLLTMTNSEITNNTAEDNGGGVYYRGVSSGDAEITMEKSSITNNEAQYGGGIYIEAPYHTNRTLKLSRGTIKNNSAEYGGGIYVGDSSALRLRLNNMKLIENQASACGGGISVIYGSLSIEVSTISQNQAAENGGGIYMPNGDLHLSYADVFQNAAGSYGGGIYAFIEGNYRLELNKSNIAENQAQNGGGIAVCAEVPGSTPDHELLVNASTIQGNIALENGGGAYYEGGSYFSLSDGAKILDNISSSGGGIWAVELGCFYVDNGVVFAGNKADEGYIMTDPADIATHELCIKTTHFSEPFTLYAYNNYDINYTKGELLVPLTINYYIRSTDTTPYATSYVYANKALETGDLPDDPSQYGLIFLGWTDENNIFYYPDTIITEDTDLYACWRLL